MNIKEFDRQYIWHPFTQAKEAKENILITKASGSYLYADSGKRYLDLASSWWTSIHGHCHPKLLEAIKTQVGKLDHVMFASFTHEPAALLAQKLIGLMPDFDRVFYSDNGSTAVEVALKMAYQYQSNIGKPGRQKFLSLEGGYHGDSFGAMSVSGKSGFFDSYNKLFFEVLYTAVPVTWDGDEEIELKEANALLELEQLLTLEGENIAGFIIEPLIQGASGMRMFRPSFLEQAVRLAKAKGIVIIFDEVMTGFGRTGTMFAYEQTQTRPDIVCLSKALTGGTLPLSVTITTDQIYQEFMGDDTRRMLVHGHTYSANPIACAAAISSIDLMHEDHSLAKVHRLGAIYRQYLPRLQKMETVFGARCKGPILAFNLYSEDVTYNYPSLKNIKYQFLDAGLNVRPLGNCMNILPSYNIEESDLGEALKGIISITSAL